jgi:gas vesicle protein
MTMKAQMAIGFGMGLLMGLFAGVIFALLFTPTKGEDLRAQLSDQWTVQKEKLTAGLGKDTGQGTEPVPEG